MLYALDPIKLKIEHVEFLANYSIIHLKLDFAQYVSLLDWQTSHVYFYSHSDRKLQYEC